MSNPAASQRHKGKLKQRPSIKEKDYVNLRSFSIRFKVSYIDSEGFIS